MYLLAADADEVVAAEQLRAAERLVGTPPEHLHYEVAPGNHLGLFMGKRTLEEYWPRIVQWLNQPSARGPRH
jgi:poly-beta-hydroxyalkanoate depolymerase